MNITRVGLWIGYAVLAIVMAIAIGAHFVTLSTFGGMVLQDQRLIAALFVDAIGLHILRIVFNASLKRQKKLGVQSDEKPMSLARVVYLTWGLMVVVTVVGSFPPKSEEDFSGIFNVVVVSLMFLIGLAVGLPMILVERRRRRTVVSDKKAPAAGTDQPVSIAPTSRPAPMTTSRAIVGAVLLTVGIVAIFGIPMLMTGGDKGDAGLLYFVIGIPVGLIVGAILIISGIVVLVTGGRSSSQR